MRELSFKLNGVNCNPEMVDDEQQTDEKLFEGLIVLGDVSISSKDALCLLGQEWLDDKIIEFYLEYLRLIKFKRFSKYIQIIGPCVAHLIKTMDSKDDAISAMLDPLKIDERRVVLIPVNNAETSSSSGTHWSLMVYVPRQKTFYHLDTLRKMNDDAANQIAHRVAETLGEPGYDLYAYNGTQQGNAHDCGVYVLVNAELAISHFLLSSNWEGFYPAQSMDMGHKRRSVLRVILELAKCRK